MLRSWVALSSWRLRTWVYGSRMGLAGRMVVSACCAAMTVAAPGSAWAAPQRLTVSDVAQPGLESTVPQGPVEAVGRGACSATYLVGEANGGPSSCPGVWPLPDASWGPRVDVASGDVLVLRGDVPLESLDVTATTRSQIGLQTPDGTPAPNVALVGPVAASPTGDTREWRLQIYSLDLRATSGLNVAMVARSDSGDTAFTATMGTPRFDDEQTRCGITYAGSALAQRGYDCTANGAPPGPAPVPFPTPMPVPTLPAKPVRVVLSGVLRLRKTHVLVGLRSSTTGRATIRVSDSRGAVLARRSLRVSASTSTRRFQVSITKRARRELKAIKRAQVSVTLRRSGRPATTTTSVKRASVR